MLLVMMVMMMPAPCRRSNSDPYGVLTSTPSRGTLNSFNTGTNP